ncbi:MAG: hypothetical protein GYB39_03420 [Algicola sp.]|nr:hypothetical protein [Algicola sp.]
MKNQFCKVGKITSKPTKSSMAKSAERLQGSLSEATLGLSKKLGLNSYCVAKPIS